MNLRLNALLVFTLLLLAGCTGPPRQASGRGAAAEEAAMADDELRELVALSRLIVVARLEERTGAGGVVRLRLRVRETLKGSVPGLLEQAGEVETSDFLFRPEQRRGGTIGSLSELAHYVFFLAPGVEEGSPYIHLRDPSEDPMPAAQPLVDRVHELMNERPPKDDLPEAPEESREDEK